MEKPLVTAFTGIARAVQLHRDADGFLTQSAHFRKASCVVHNGAVGIVADDHAHDGKHADRGHGDSDESVALAQRLTQHIGHQGGNGDAHHGRKGGNEAVGNGGEDGEGRTGAGGMRHLLHDGL